MTQGAGVSDSRLSGRLDAAQGTTLPRRSLATRLLPVKPPGRFRTRRDGEHLVMSVDNVERYAPFVELVRGRRALEPASVDARAARADK